MSTRRCGFLLSAVMFVLALTTLCPLSLWAGTGFQPVNPDELKMTSDPKAPGGNVIGYTRTFEVKELSVPVDKTEDLRKFYRIIAGDERNTVVLKAASK